MNTPKIFAASILLGTLLFLSSCKKEDSSDVNQDKIYAEYELYYDANQNKTYASAVFKFSNALGTNLQLTAPSYIRFNGDTIPYAPVFAYYRKEYAGQINSGTFVFATTDGTLYTNTVSLPSSISNPAVDTISKSNSFTYPWIGNAVAANESVGLTIAHTANAAYFKYFLQLTVGANDLVLGAADLNYLPVGPATCSIERTKETSASATTSAGGRARGKYRALNTNTYIKN